MNDNYKFTAVTQISTVSVYFKEQNDILEVKLILNHTDGTSNVMQVQAGQNSENDVR